MHEVWYNHHMSLEVTHQYWRTFGVERFGKFEGLYQSFLFKVVQNRALEVEEVKYLQSIFADYMASSDRDTGDNIIHYYVRNNHLKLDVLQYLCRAYPDLCNKDAQ